MENNITPDAIAKKAAKMAEQMQAAHMAEQIAQEEKQREFFDRVNRTADAIMPILDGWTVGEIELLLAQCVMQRVKDRATYSVPTKP